MDNQILNLNNKQYEKSEWPSKIIEKRIEIYYGRNQCASGELQLLLLYREY